MKDGSEMTRSITYSDRNAPKTSEPSFRCGFFYGVEGQLVGQADVVPPLSVRNIAGSIPAVPSSVLSADIQNADSSAVGRLSGLLSLTASNPKHENELQGDFLVESLVGLGIGKGIRLVIA